MYSANFYFVAVLTWTMKVKNNPSLSDFKDYSYAPNINPNPLWSKLICLLLNIQIL